MQSLGFESKNPTIYQMIADLDKEGQVRASSGSNQVTAQAKLQRMA